MSDAEKKYYYKDSAEGLFKQISSFNGQIQK